ncbi:glycoside hydrolase family 97 catalytic domain-containing protein [Lewinella sp. IMCC34183]|uniref:glycoside hydrolase family 97 catalytic domain-containing protein n=1 Tax=Lewinella sp. IMCC34183 TaxID=2248762 RepID=UPI0018E5436F|nr:glycoside hydrolase family 97 catalytic domain-containing protein [Lewinella sp. IMCC34183]
MQQHTTRLIPLLLLVLLATAVRAEVRLPRLISDGMVLQRDTELTLWGWADTGEAVTVSLEGTVYPAEVTSSGHWQVQLPPHAAGGPFVLSVSGNNTVEVRDILFGDVWLCSGQSNMELPMRVVGAGYTDVIASAKNDAIRQFNVPKKHYFDGPREDYTGGEWTSADPESVLDFTAVGYFFAREINERYDVPVGLINASLGGSPAEAWMSPDALRSFPDLYDEAVRYRDTAYVSSISNGDRERIGNWYRELAASDAGYPATGSSWSLPDYDDADWASTEVPGFWQDTPLGAVNGAVWYRRKLEVPAAWVGKEVQLPFGNIVEADSVWINGTFIGSRGSQYIPRQYTVPAGVLKSGTNDIAVRVVSPAGRGGFVPDKTYALVSGTDTLDLTGTWKYKLGTKMEPLRGPTFIQWKPVGLYNGMIAPLLSYGTRGVLWYQGESNVGRATQYRTLFPALIENWRTNMDAPELPFLSVQLPNFGERRDAPGESGWAVMREAQVQSLQLDNTGLATTIDIGEWNDIHPMNKRDVGHRLAVLAERQVYGDDVVASGPTFRELKIAGDRAILSFDHVAGGLRSSDGKPLRHFSIAGADGRFVRANATIEGKTVIVSSEEVTAPVAVRYAWADAPDHINFYNSADLPARPFRTDAPAATDEQQTVSSPDGAITAIVDVDRAEYSIRYGDKVILHEGKFGVVRDDGDFSQHLRTAAVSDPTVVTDSYQTHNAKKSSITYEATERTWEIRNEDGQRMNLVFRVSDDGVAFRYVFPGESADVKQIVSEATTFHFREGTRAWLQPKTEAQSGFEHSNPSYEAHYQLDISTGTPSPGPNGWVYPALFRYDSVWMLLTEADLGRTYSGTALQQESPDNEYAVNFPQPEEVFTNGTPTRMPESTLPWRTPWRIITIGDLKTIQESTLGTDLAAPAVQMDSSFIQPGKAAWSWILKKDAGTVYEVQKDYIDFAADMDWQYCLIDANWDVTIGYDSVALLADYARTKDVELLLWYNSAGSWNTVPFTPRDKLLTHAGRVAEFTKLKEMGIRGIKIDFFGGDGQSMINYYHDILEDAADYDLLLNFHGATLPRGLQRTYPNFMTTEAVFGYEMITFGQGAADRAPEHIVSSAMIRNVFDPMDFTPVNFGGIPGRVKRVTSEAYELATSVALLSGIQHYAEQPEGMAKVPEYVRDFLRGLPDYWDDVRFLTGYPGKDYVVARRTGDRWYVAGLNGEGVAKTFTLDLGFLNGRTGTLIAGGADGTADQPSFRREEISLPADGRLEVSVGPSDGFVIEFGE